MADSLNTFHPSVGKVKNPSGRVGNETPSILFNT
jgi:hypothetical protein